MVDTKRTSRVAAAGRQPSSTFLNDATGRFWTALQANAKILGRWSAVAVSSYRRTLKDEPMPGIWPRYTARLEIAMALHQAMEEGNRSLPAAFRESMASTSLADIDFYAVAERLLTDAVIGGIDGRSKPLRTKRP
jgi:hypothetical protein